MAELRLIKSFYVDGSPLIYRVHGKTHPKFGKTYEGYVWIQALTGDIAGTLFSGLVDFLAVSAESPALRASWSLAAPPVATSTRQVIWRWSDSKPQGYEMKEDEIL